MRPKRFSLKSHMAGGDSWQTDFYCGKGKTFPQQFLEKGQNIHHRVWKGKLFLFSHRALNISHVSIYSPFVDAVLALCVMSITLTGNLEATSFSRPTDLRFRGRGAIFAPGSETADPCAKEGIKVSPTVVSWSLLPHLLEPVRSNQNHR